MSIDRLSWQPLGKNNFDVKAISATCYSGELRKSCRNHYLVAGDKGSDLQERADRTSDNGRLRDLQRSYERYPPTSVEKEEEEFNIFRI